MPHALTEQVLAALPQTQCTRCGYPDCAGYAQAVATGAAPINQCPPGGTHGIQRLSQITGQPITPLNPEFGLEGPRSVAVIDENWCIGCTLCLPVCPTDAILGSNKLMHTVIESYCTGCALCLPVCPVDCITLENVTDTATGWDAWSPAQADVAKNRYQFHSWSRYKTKGLEPKTHEEKPEKSKLSVIQAALARSRQQRSGS
jgi:Na+-translocating ferredoxin:NAD+ oxidoreductase subunit B